MHWKRGNFDVIAGIWGAKPRNYRGSRRAVGAPFGYLLSGFGYVFRLTQWQGLGRDRPFATVNAAFCSFVSVVESATMRKPNLSLRGLWARLRVLGLLALSGQLDGRNYKIRGYTLRHVAWNEARISE